MTLRLVHLSQDTRNGISRCTNSPASSRSSAEGAWRASSSWTTRHSSRSASRYPSIRPFHRRFSASETLGVAVSRQIHQAQGIQPVKVDGGGLPRCGAGSGQRLAVEQSVDQGRLPHIGPAGKRHLPADWRPAADEPAPLKAQRPRIRFSSFSPPIEEYPRRRDPVERRALLHEPAATPPDRQAEKPTPCSARYPAFPP